MSERLYLRLDEDDAHGPEADVPAGSLRAFAVAPALAGCVSHVLHCRESVPDGHELREHVLPDGAVHLVFNLGDPPAAGDAGGGLRIEAIGASAAPALVRLRGRIDGWSVTLRPGAAAALLGVPAGEIAGTVVPLEALWRREAGELLERLHAAPDDRTRNALLQRSLLHRLQQAATPRGATTSAPALHAAHAVAAAGGRRPLREIARELGLSERRLQQLFHAHVGLAPRQWSRLARLRDCLRGLRREARSAHAPSWAGLAADHGFYDQSHLSNEFRALAGMTPGEFLRRATAHRVAGSSKTAA